MDISDAKKIHALVIDARWVEAANTALGLIGAPPTVTTQQKAVGVLRNLFQHLLDSEQYLHAATLQFGPNIFNTEPESTVRVFETLTKGNLILFQGASSMSKTYAAGAWMLLDYLRDPYYTSVKLAAISEKHLKENLFPHVVKLWRNLAIPTGHAIEVRESDLWLGIKAAGFEFGISGIAFKQSQETSGQFKGYKSMPVRRKPHPKFGYFSRLRVLGDECVRGDQRVSMSDGSLVAIKDIVDKKTAGMVLCVNDYTGKVESKKITGWHKVPLCGRKMIDVCGAIITEDHPVLTDFGEYKLAINAKTCFRIGHEKLSTSGMPKSPAEIPCNWWTTGRFFHKPDLRQERKREGALHSWGGAAKLPEVEKGDNGKFHDGTDSRPPEDGVRGFYLQILDQKPPSIYGDSRNNLPGSRKKIHPEDNPKYGCAGDGGVVHGRREHVQEQRVQNTNCDDSDLFAPKGGCGFSDISPTKYIWNKRQSETKQGKVGDLHECGGNEKISGDNNSICSPRLGLQIDRDAASAEAADKPDNGADSERMQDMRKAFSEATPGDNVRPYLQQETSSVDGKQEIQEDAFVYCIDVEDNHNFFVEGVCVHNCQNWPGGPFQDFNSLIASMDGADKIKIACAFNPENTTCRIVQMAEPPDGWRVEDMETLYQWVSRKGWMVCRLDAALCENVIQKKTIYEGLQTYEGYLSYLKDGGDNSAAYSCFARGWPPMKGSIDTIIPPAWPQQARGECTFLENPLVIASVDLAFMGKDSAQMAIGRWGLADGWRDHMGIYHQFFDRLNIKNSKPHHVLQIDQILPMQKHDDTVKMAEEIMGRAKMMRIRPENLIVDKTSIGLGVHSHLNAVWGPSKGVSWNEKATSAKILAEDLDGADMQCEGVISEMWWTFQRWLNPTCCAILINPVIPVQPINTQLTSRRRSTGKAGKIVVESKDKYKARNGGQSPDESDALIMMPFLVRQISDVLPGLVEQQTRNTSTEGAIKFETVKTIVSHEIDKDDCLADEGTEKDKFEP